MIILYILFFAFVYWIYCTVKDIFKEIKTGVEKKQVKKQKQTIISDTTFDRIKYVRISGYNTIRKEHYSLDYYVDSGQRNYSIPEYSLFIDSRVFCDEHFTKDIIVFLDSNKNRLDLSKHPYTIRLNSDADCGFIIFYA